MITRLGDAIFWVAIGVACFSLLFVSSQSVFDDLLGIQRSLNESERAETQWLLSALLFAFYFSIGWAIRFVLNDRFDVGIGPTKADSDARNFSDFVRGVIRRTVFLLGWGSLRLAVLLAVCALIYGFIFWDRPDIELVAIPLIASGMLALIGVTISLGNYVLTGKGKVKR